MRILAIESSCDESAAAVVEDSGYVLASAVASQIKEHAPFGGVVPELASRAHMRAVLPVVREALTPFGGDHSSIDAIAVTAGPGLMGALLVGAQIAKALAFTWKRPLVGVNHLHGHLMSAYLNDGTYASCLERGQRFVALLVSGGHTALYDVVDPQRITLLGQTRDDAAGEAYDKVAKLLGLGYPGGPVLDKLAQSGNPQAYALPIPMRRRENLEFSFSGLKTAVVQRLRSGEMFRDPQALADFAASFQRVVVESLLSKSLAACKRVGVQQLVIVGGVAANQGLREEARVRCATAGIKLCVPPLRFCTDNAAMIGYAGIVNYQNKQAGTLSSLTVDARAAIGREQVL